MSTSAIDATFETRKPISPRAARNARDWCQKSANTEYDVSDYVERLVRKVYGGAFGRTLRGSTKAEARCHLYNLVAGKLIEGRRNRNRRIWIAQKAVKKALEGRYIVIVQVGNSRRKQWGVKITETGREYLATATKQNDPSTRGAQRRIQQGEFLA